MKIPHKLLWASAFGCLAFVVSGAWKNANDYAGQTHMGSSHHRLEEATSSSAVIPRAQADRIVSLQNKRSSSGRHLVSGRKSDAGNEQAIALATTLHEDGNGYSNKLDFRKNNRVEKTRSSGSPQRFGEQAWSSVNSESPGHFLVSKNVSVKVEQVQTSPGSTGVGLSLIVVPEQVDTEVAGEENESGEIPEASKLLDGKFVPSEITATFGLTYEQELFRTKWGWSAFDQVQKVLSEEAGP